MLLVFVKELCYIIFTWAANSMVEYSAFNRFVPGSIPGQPNKKGKTIIKQYPQGNSNPRYLREREMS